MGKQKARFGGLFLRCMARRAPAVRRVRVTRAPFSAPESIVFVSNSLQKKLIK